jgi:hypothetical protein
MRMVQLLASFVCGLHYMSCIYWATAVHIGFDDDPEHVWVPDTSFHEAPFGEKCTLRLHRCTLHDYLSTQLLYNIDHLCTLRSPGLHLHRLLRDALLAARVRRERYTTIALRGVHLPSE